MEHVKNEAGEFQGLLLYKVPKAASTTLAGLVFHLHNKTGGCAIQAKHFKEGVEKIEYKFIDKQHSFVFAPIRDPASRDISHVRYFRFGKIVKVNQKNNPNPTAAQYYQALMRQGRNAPFLYKGWGGFQFRYIVHGDLGEIVSKDYSYVDYSTVHHKLHSEIQRFGFFFVAERMDESIVAFANLLGLDIRDVVLPGKANVRDGGYYLNRDGKRSENICRKRHIFPKLPNETMDFLESPKYKRIEYADMLLHRIANYSLDLTIEHTIGAEKFAKDLAQYRHLTDRVQAYCGQRLGGGCYSNGTAIEPVEKCYHEDMGCGYECVNEYMATYG